MRPDDNQLELKREQQNQLERLTKDLADSKEANKAMILQRKTLIQGKESVQKELDKVLRRTGKEIEEISAKLRDKTLEFDAIKKESDQTIVELREKNTQVGQINERLYVAKQVLEKERKELQESLTKKMKECLKMEDDLRNQLL